MIALIPVSRFRVTYQVATGRPFSRFEELVLRAVGEGDETLDLLRNTFQVHRRLIIEALVTLTQLGWVALGEHGGRFVLTSAGAAAVTTTSGPPPFSVAPRVATIIMERVTGGLLQGTQARPEGRIDLGRVWHDSYKFAPVVGDNSIDEGRVHPLLAHAAGEWVRAIESIDIIAKDSLYVPVAVDETTGKLVGLPDQWVPRLERYFAAAGLTGHAYEASRVAPTVPREIAEYHSAEAAKMGHRPSGPSAEEALDTSRILTTATEHSSLFEHVVDTATSVILLVLPSITAEAVAPLVAKLAPAMNRGVYVHLLWGSAQVDAGERGIKDALTKAAYDLSAQFKDRLKYNRSPSRLLSSILLWDEGGEHHATVGTHHWSECVPTTEVVTTLSMGDPGAPSCSISVRLSHPTLVAAIARVIAGAWRGTPREEASAGPDRWRRVASDLEALGALKNGAGSIPQKDSGDVTKEDFDPDEPPVSPPPTDAQLMRVTLIIGPDHPECLDYVVRETGGPLSLVTSRVTALAATEILALRGRLSKERVLEIQYGIADGDLTDLVAEGEQFDSPMLVRQIANAAGEVLVSTHAFCVSLRSFLARAVSRRTDIGLFVEGEAAVQKAREAVARCGLEGDR